jgi:hypothetical protein
MNANCELFDEANGPVDVDARTQPALAGRARRMITAETIVRGSSAERHRDCSFGMGGGYAGMPSACGCTSFPSWPVPIASLRKLHVMKWRDDLATRSAAARVNGNVWPDVEEVHRVVAH